MCQFYAMPNFDGLGIVIVVGLASTAILLALILGVTVWALVNYPF